MIGAPPRSAVAAQRAALEAARRRTALQVDTLAHAVVDMDDAVGWARLTELGTRSTVVAQESAVSATADLLNATLNAADIVGDIASLPGIQPGRLASGNDVRGMFAATRDIVARRMTAPDVTFPMALDASASKLVAIASSEPHRIGRDGQLAVGLSDDRFNRYRRVAVGNTCTFCLMLATRGAVYLTAASAGQSRKYHAHCDCYVELVVDQDAIARSQALQGDWRNAIRDPQRLIDAGAMDGALDVADDVSWQRGSSGAPLERTPLVRSRYARTLDDFVPSGMRLSPEQVAQEADRLRGNAYAYGRQREQALGVLDYKKSQLEQRKAYLRQGGFKPQALRGDREYRELSEQVKYWTDEAARLERDAADALAEADAVEHTGLTKGIREAVQRELDKSPAVSTYKDALGAIIVDEKYVQSVLPSHTVDDVADITRQNLYDALDALPENVRRHVLRDGYTVRVDADAGNIGAAGFTYAGESFRGSGTSLKVWVHPNHAGSMSSRGYDMRTVTDNGYVTRVPGMSHGAIIHVHELGHMVDRLDMDQVDALFEQVVPAAGIDMGFRLLSGYGRTKAREMVAETFVRWVRGDTDEVVRMVAKAQGWADL